MAREGILSETRSIGKKPEKNQHSRAGMDRAVGEIPEEYGVKEDKKREHSKMKEGSAL